MEPTNNPFRKENDLPNLQDVPNLEWIEKISRGNNYLEVQDT